MTLSQVKVPLAGVTVRVAEVADCQYDDWEAYKVAYCGREQVPLGDGRG